MVSTVGSNDSKADKLSNGLDDTFPVLAEVIAEVLALPDSPEPGENFIALGGDSVKALRVLARLRRKEGLLLDLRSFLAAATLRSIASRLSLEDGLDDDGALELPAVLSPSLSQHERLARDQRALRDGRRPFPQHLVWAGRLRGRLDVEALQRALHRVVDRHQAVRWCFDTEVDRIGASRMGSEPSTVDTIRIAPIDQWCWEVVELPHAVGTSEAELTAVLVDAVDEPFDVRSGKLLRPRLYRIDDEDHVVLIVVEHLISDQWSMRVLVDDLIRFYRAETTSDESVVAEPGDQFARWVRDERERVKRGALHGAVEWWRSELRDGPPAPMTPIPTDNPVAADTNLGGSRTHFLSDEDVAGIDALCRAEHVTPFVVAHAVVAAWLALLNGEGAVDVVTPSSNRSDLRYERTVGRFASRMVLRFPVELGMTFRGLLQEIASFDATAVENSWVPWGLVVQETMPENFGVAQSRPYIFLDFDDRSEEITWESFTELTCEQLEVPRTAPPGVSLCLVREPSGMRVVLGYDRELLSDNAADEFIVAVTQVMNAALAEPGARIGHLSGLARTWPHWMTPGCREPRRESVE